MNAEACIISNGVQSRLTYDWAECAVHFARPSLDGGAHTRDAGGVNAGSQAFVLCLPVGGESVLSASNRQNVIGRHPDEF